MDARSFSGITSTSGWGSGCSGITPTSGSGSGLWVVHPDVVQSSAATPQTSARANGEHLIIAYVLRAVIAPAGRFRVSDNRVALLVAACLRRCHRPDIS